MPSGWYYVESGQQAGPLENSEIERLVAQGTISAQTLVWRKGLGDWEEAGLHFKMVDADDVPPPIPQNKTTAVNPESLDGPDDRKRMNIEKNPISYRAPARSFGEAISVCFDKYGTFSGRASRSEYWNFYLFVTLVVLGSWVADKLYMGIEYDVGIFSASAGLLLLLPILSVTVRRLHDINRSAWWIGGWWIAATALCLALFTISILVPDPDSAVFGDALDWVMIACALAHLIYSIVMIVFLCMPGNTHKNRFG